MEISEILQSESSFLYTILHNVRFSDNNSGVCNLFFWYLSFIQIKDDHLILSLSFFKMISSEKFYGRLRNTDVSFVTSLLCALILLGGVIFVLNRTTDAT